ncbi:MAG TPA: portal protein, partial [Candidatus Paceibacterota bacterium]|nr:portal protein [Candidatus Paceibacterota bacterium]
GAQYMNDIDDVKYIRDKVVSSLKIPYSYLLKDDSSGENRETLAQKDIRFANTIKRLQKSVISELEKIGMIHLILLGYKNEDMLRFKIKLNNPSRIAELQELEVWKAKLSSAREAMDTNMSYRWITEKMLGISFDEAKRIKREVYHDAKFDAAILAIREGGSGEGGGMEGFGDGGGDDAMGLDYGGGEMDDFGSDDKGIPAGKKDNPLLAAPAKRDEKKSYDERGKGARERSYQKYSKRLANPSMPGSIKGLAKGIFSNSVFNEEVDDLLEGMFEKEEENSTYKEEDIFNTDKRVKKIIQEVQSGLLKKKEKEDVET